MPDCKCKFYFEFTGDAEDHFKELKRVLESYKGTVTGNATAGSFSVPVPLLRKIHGTFSVSGQTAEVCITKKSWMLSCKRVEKFMRKNVPWR